MFIKTLHLRDLDIHKCALRSDLNWKSRTDRNIVHQSTISPPKPAQDLENYYSIVDILFVESQRYIKSLGCDLTNTQTINVLCKSYGSKHCEQHGSNISAYRSSQNYEEFSKLWNHAEIPKLERLSIGNGLLIKCSWSFNIWKIRCKHSELID